MSIARCPHCELVYDQDFNVEHEDECKYEREDAERESEIWRAKRLLKEEGYKVTK